MDLNEIDDASAETPRVELSAREQIAALESTVATLRFLLARAARRGDNAERANDASRDVIRRERAAAMEWKNVAEEERANASVMALRLGEAEAHLAALDAWRTDGGR